MGSKQALEMVWDVSDLFTVDGELPGANYVFMPVMLVF